MEYDREDRWLLNGKFPNNHLQSDYGRNSIFHGLQKLLLLSPQKHTGRWEGGRAAERVEERKEGRHLNKKDPQGRNRQQVWFLVKMDQE